MELLNGLLVKANHPITVMNPEKTFVITDTKIENDRLYVRGDDTMWFEQSMVSRELKTKPKISNKEIK